MMALVKKGYLKRATARKMNSKRRIKSVMQIEHMTILIKKLYWKPASKVAAVDRRFLVQQMFLFLRMR